METPQHVAGNGSSHMNDLSSIRSLRILHLLSHVSPGRRYGGPNTVALTQAEGLIERGHDVMVAAGSNDYPLGRTTIGNVPAMLFPSRPLLPGSFGARIAPGLSRWVRQKSGQFDIVHIHLARDLSVLPAATRVHVPATVQPHGMLAAASDPLRRAVDTALVRRVMANAGMGIALNESEARVLNESFGMVDVEVLPNAVAVATVRRRNIAGGDLNILFLARLHARKRPMLFAQAAVELARRGLTARYTIVGPDEGEARHVRDIIASAPAVDIRLTGPATAAEVADCFAAADIYVLPARGEPFGLTMLESLSAGTPVIADRDSPLGRQLAGLGLARLFDGTVEGLVDAIAALASDRSARSEIARIGPDIVQRHWGVGGMIRKLEKVYERTLEERKHLLGRRSGEAS